ncbi:TetR family transcriptional regulator [Pseudoroseomonas wenyumeiae]|uniref:TetR family transcriptional regulator n=1 Tax=Teichococcus wenyumeiae TaxID=2478470 RepID=A0A3A9J926_9PROT|nr:TetR/AcrR family transcriptional regulator [Pseudoroseomonas wenyumeiae]RKK02550.1 TetR/AcrR family transcriptional regulator [Pseudoroseomonas wenyumeiae]RMI15337.1 TetR family transcriptional regulator [Pseudoroseomonas wenyumeiae]
MRSTAERIVDEARRLIMTRGYNGFSYADVAEVIGIRKASIHHHFASKSDLAKAVVDQSRAVIRAQVEHLAEAEPEASAQLRAYATYWEHCIADNTAPFCVAAMLAAELPSLPADLAASVRLHFAELVGWLTQLLALGVRQGSVSLVRSPAEEADAFMSAIYGAMLSARAFGEPERFTAITETLLSRVVRLH